MMQHPVGLLVIGLLALARGVADVVRAVQRTAINGREITDTAVYRYGRDRPGNVSRSGRRARGLDFWSTGVLEDWVLAAPASEAF